MSEVRTIKARLEVPTGRVIGQYDLAGNPYLRETRIVTGGTLATPTLRGRDRVLHRCTALAEVNPSAVFTYLLESGASVDSHVLYILDEISGE